MICSIFYIQIEFEAFTKTFISDLVWTTTAPITADIGLILRLQDNHAPIRRHYTMVSQIHSQIKYEMRNLVHIERSFQRNRCD